MTTPQFYIYDEDAPNYVDGITGNIEYIRYFNEITFRPSSAGSEIEIKNVGVYVIHVKISSVHPHGVISLSKGDYTFTTHHSDEQHQYKTSTVELIRVFSHITDDEGENDE